MAGVGPTTRKGPPLNIAISLPWSPAIRHALCTKCLSLWKSQILEVLYRNLPCQIEIASGCLHVLAVFFARIEYRGKFSSSYWLSEILWWDESWDRYLIYLYLFWLFWFHVCGFLRSRKGAHNVTRICNLEAPSLRSWSGNTTRHDIRHGITLNHMAARSWSSNIHRTFTVRRWNSLFWSTGSPLESLESRDFPWFSLFWQQNQRNDSEWCLLAPSKIWNRMRLHDAPCWNPFFFPDFDCRLQIVFFPRLASAPSMCFRHVRFLLPALLSISQHFQFGHRNASRPTGSIQSCSLWESQCHSEEKINRDWQNKSKWHDTSDTTCWDHDKDDKAR